MGIFGVTSNSAGGSSSYTDNSFAAAYNSRMMEKQMKFNAQEAQKRRDFELMMSNTSYQRAVKDMMQAGINPVLAAQNGGASTGSGNAANTSAASIGSNAYGSSWNSAQSVDNGMNMLSDLMSYLNSGSAGNGVIKQGIDFGKMIWNETGKLFTDYSKTIGSRRGGFRGNSDGGKFSSWSNNKGGSFK